MATVQQLEKLHQIQRLFYVEDSLEAAVAGERVASLISKTEQLLRQRAFLRDERRRLRISSDVVSERERALAFMRRDDWLPADIACVCDQRRTLQALRRTLRQRELLEATREGKLQEASGGVEEAEIKKLNAAIAGLSADAGAIVVKEEELRHVMINIGGLVRATSSIQDCIR